MTKKNIIAISLLLVAISGFGIYKYSQRNVINSKFSNIELVDYGDSLVSSSDEVMKDADSVFHSKICSDYGVAWEATEYSTIENKIVLLDSYSGKLLVYFLDKNENYSKLNVNPANQLFGWNFSEKPVDNKIKGEIISEEKDSIFYWIHNDKENLLTDEKGLVYKRVNIPKTGS